jgi:hypothetical protein
VPFKWEDQEEAAFQELKQALTTQLVLALPRDKGRFRLEMDTSNIATGAVLLQEQEDGTYCPLSYTSKSCSQAEAMYATYNKELFMIMRALEDWQSLLLRTSEPFEILMDHCNLAYY